MLVCGQRVIDSPLAHQEEADCIAQGIGLIGALPEQFNRLNVLSPIDPDDFQRVVKQNFFAERRTFGRGKPRIKANATYSAKM